MSDWMGSRLVSLLEQKYQNKLFGMFSSSSSS